MARRINVRRSAAGDGAIPSFSSRASTKASTGERTHARFLTVGVATGRIGLNAQCPARRIGGTLARGCRRGDRGSGISPGRTHLNPAPEGVHFRLGKLPLGGHLQFLVAIRHGLDQQALVGFSRHDRRARRSSFENRLAAVQTQIRRLLRRSVAFLARIAEDRSNEILEEVDGLPVGPIAKAVLRPRGKAKRQHDQHGGHWPLAILRSRIKDGPINSHGVCTVSPAGCRGWVTPTAFNARGTDWHPVTIS